MPIRNGLQLPFLTTPLKGSRSQKPPAHSRLWSITSNLCIAVTMRGLPWWQVLEKVFLIRICVVAPGSPVKKQGIEFFFGLPSGRRSVHPVSKHTPTQFDLHPQVLGLQPAPFLSKDLFGDLLCESTRVVKVGHRFFCANMKLSQSSASWRPGSMMETVSLAPCQAAEHFCENTSQRIPSLQHSIAVQELYHRVQARKLYCSPWAPAQLLHLAMTIDGFCTLLHVADEEAFMEHCAKRWQTRDGTYQLKRRRLKPDVRDPPENGSADVDMADIWILDDLEEYCMVEENLWGAERGTLFHRAYFAFSLVVGFCLVLVGWWVLCCFVCFFQGNLQLIWSFHSFKFPVVDRPRLVLVRQCRKKKLGLMRKTATVVTMRAAIGQKKVSKAATWFGWSLLFEFFRRCFLFVCCCNVTATEELQRMAVLRRVRQRSLVTSCWSDVWNCSKMVLFVWCKLKPRISWLDKHLSLLESSQKKENDEQLNRKLCESQPIKNEGLKFSWCFLKFWESVKSAFTLRRETSAGKHSRVCGQLVVSYNSSSYLYFFQFFSPCYLLAA